ncbi:MAG: selenide, water dikinase SelD [Negativicutes bacterium]|jgi:selenide,water dikinase
MAKIEPGALSEIVAGLPRIINDNVLVGMDTSDDAVVYKLNDDIAIIQTLDFFPPPVDDPYLFGQIAAANSLSDVYAMGGKPITAMNIVAFPLCALGKDTLAEILRGSAEKCIEAGAVIAGGHSIEDKEPKFGLSVTGIVHPKKVLANRGAIVGDVLVLTKPVGSGVLITAAQAELFADSVNIAYSEMVRLNKYAAEIMVQYPVHACTDITGFGLLGHTFEMTEASAVKVVINSADVPILADALAAADMGFVPAGVYNNRTHYTEVSFADNVGEAMRDVLFDPQTSGGLLIALAKNEAMAMSKQMIAAGIIAAVVGEVVENGNGEIYVK